LSLIAVKITENWAVAGGNILVYNTPLEITSRGFFIPRPLPVLTRYATKHAIPPVQVIATRQIKVTLSSLIPVVYRYNDGYLLV